MNCLLRDNPNQSYLIIDTETENLSLVGKNRPWSCGYIVYQNGKIIEEHDHYIWWDDLSISKDAERITRFNYQAYKSKAQDPNKTLDKFETYLSDKRHIIVYHNGSGFDCYIIKNWREALGRKNDYSYLDRTIDTNSLARAIKKGVKKIERKDWKLMMFRFANYRERGMKTSLTALGKEFGIDVNYEALHSSVNDTILNALVWDHLKFKIDI